MRAALYARVSSLAQRDAHTIESQLRTLPDFAGRRGWPVVDTYIDDGKSAKSGRLGARAGLTRLLADVAAGKIDVVVVVDIDRLTRAEDLTERGAVLGAFQRAGVKIAVATSGQILDFATTHGDLLGSLYAFFAAEENRKRRERTIAGKLTAIARGRKPSGPTPFGYHYSKVDGWSVDTENGARVCEMFRRSLAGETCEAIALDFEARAIPRPRAGRWNRERVWQIITSRTYLGEWRADKRRGLVVPVPQVVDADTWQRTQERLAANGRRGLDRTRHCYLAAKIAVCELCGAQIGIATAIRASTTRVATPGRYVCAHRRRPLLGQAPCELPIHRTAEVDEALWGLVVDVLERDDLVADVLRRRRAAAEDSPAWERDLAAARAHVDRLDRTEAALLARFRRGQVSERALDVELDALGREREAAKRQADTAQRAISGAGLAAERVDALEERLASLRNALAGTSLEERAEIVRGLVEPGALVLGPDRMRCRLALMGPTSHSGAGGQPSLGDSASTSSVAPVTVAVSVSLRSVRGAR